MSITEMSSNEIEHMFVTSFFKKEVQDRALYLLNSKNKRRDFFKKIQGNDPRVRIECIERLPLYDSKIEKKMILETLKKHGAEKFCYIMSFHREIDKSVCALEDGVEKCLDSLMPTIICCAINLALMQAEQMQGSPSRALLRCN